MAGRWYWRAEDHREPRNTVWTGWTTADEVAPLVVAAAARRPERTTDVEVSTVSDLFDAFVDDCDGRPDLKPTTIRRYRAACRRVADTIGRVRIELVGAAVVESGRNRLLRTYAPHTVHHDLRIARIAWTWGRRLGYIDRPMPIARVNLPALYRHTPTPRDVARALDALQGGPRWRRAMVRLLYATGARLGEVATLRWADVDGAGGRMVVTGKRGPRMLPITRPIVEVLDELPHRVDYVLGVAPRTSAGKIHKHVRAACRRAAVPLFTPQGLRRAAVDRLQRQGVDPGTACALLGHSPAIMLEKYRQASEADLRAAAMVLATVPSADNLIVPPQWAGEER